jgi:DNA-binding IclR family transcriptional regulator
MAAKGQPSKHLAARGLSPTTNSSEIADPASESPLERYIRVLENVSLSNDGLSVSEVAAACNFPVVTAHRLVSNLHRVGVLQTAGSTRKHYQFGQRLLRLLHAGHDRVKLAIAVQPVLDALADKLANTCFLARLAGSQVVSVAWAVPGDGLSGYVIPGHSRPAHAAAGAKAILAVQSDALRDDALRLPLKKLAGQTLTSRDAVEREYARVRKRGYATCWNEIENGLGAIAVPIEVPGAGVIYSVGTAGLTERVYRRTEHETVEMLRSAVAALTHAVAKAAPV